MLVERGQRADSDSEFADERPLRLHRRFASYSCPVRFGGYSTRVNPIRMPSNTITLRSSRRRYRTSCRYRDRWTAEYIRTRRAFCTGILVLLTAATSASGIERNGNVGTESYANLHPDSFRPAIICSLKDMSPTAFEGNWSIYESDETIGTRAVIVAFFARDSFTPLQSGFLGTSDSQYRRSELWPSSSFSGLVVCQVGSEIRRICILPAPRLVWSFYRGRAVTLERKPSGPSAFGDVYCRALGTDPAPRTFTRTVWGLNGHIIVATSKQSTGRITFHWSDKIPDRVSINSTSMALSIKPQAQDSITCVTCIAGIGENILSLPVTECRYIKGHYKITEIKKQKQGDCVCIHRYVFSAVCSASVMFSVYGLVRMYTRCHRGFM